jgi:hypothetical protein
LTEEGYRPWIDEDGNVAFKCEGRVYVIEIDEKDEEFFCLVYRNFWAIESDDELAQVKEAALVVAADIKVVKVFPVEDTEIWASIELFCFPPQTFTAVFDHCLNAMRDGVEKFVATMQEDKPKNRPSRPMISSFMFPGTTRDEISRIQRIKRENTHVPH